MQKNLTIKDYINKLSSKDAVPGGGSAAALGASISSALTSMVFNLTVGKKAFEDYSEEEKEMIYNVSEKIKTYNEVEYSCKWASVCYGYWLAKKTS